MQRRIAVAVGTAVLLLLASPALACNTVAWLTHGPVGGPGEPLEISGGGFAPGTGELTWGSGGESLAEYEVGEDGRLSATIDVPEHASGRTPVVADHRDGEASESAAHPAAWVDVVVPVHEAAPAAAPNGDVDRSLPTTAWSALLVVATLLALVVPLRMAFVRRDRTDRVSDRVSDGVEAELQEILAEERSLSSDA